MENPRRHVNPDNTEGGLISKSAVVSGNAFIGRNVRICGNARVESGAKIYDNSVIQDSAWIQSRVVIKDFAQIGGNSSLRGSDRKLTIVSDYSKVLGSARIQDSTISGRSLIEGSPTLVDVKVSSGHVCNTFIMKELYISDDYFCNLFNKNYSRIIVRESNFSIDALNEVPKYIEFKAEKFKFNRDSKKTTVVINNNVVSSENIKVLGNLIRILDLSSIREGENTISIYGLDEYGKKIEQRNFDVYFGSRKISIQIDRGASDQWQFFSKIFLDGEEYSVSHSWANGLLTLKGVPFNFPTDANLNLYGFSKNHVFWGKWSLSSVPFNILPYVVPGFENNIGDYSNLAGWMFSHPENVTIDTSMGYKRMLLQSDPSNEVLAIKRIKLKPGITGAEIAMHVEDIANLFTTFPDTEVGIFSFEDSFYRIYELKSDTIFTYAKTVNNVSKFLASFVKKTKNPEYYFVFKIKPAASRGLTAIFDPFVFQNISVEFSPYDLWVYNLTDEQGAPERGYEVLRTESVTNCDDPGYDLSDDDTVRVGFNKIEKFFSGRYFPYQIPLMLQENRIWGDLVVRAEFQSGVKIESFTFNSIELVGYQTGHEVFRKSLSSCAGERAVELFGNEILRYQLSQNRANYLFTLSEDDLLNISSNRNSAITLQVEVIGSYTILDELEGRFEDSFRTISPLPDTPLKLLFSANVDSNFYSATPDHWDTNVKGQLRTGGDKWILPAYDEITKQIVEGAGWRMNDSSKINGGNFEGHSGHTSGIDIDINFPVDGDLRHNFNQYGMNYSRWTRALSKIEAFLNGLDDNIEFIKSIFITTIGPTNGHFLRNRFQYRCISNRFIDLDMPIGEANNSHGLNRTLLREEMNHHNHLHVSYNQPQNNGFESRVARQLPMDIALSDLEFEIVNGNLEITPRNQSYNGIAILWRAQMTSSYEDITERVYFGKWDNGGVITPLNQPQLPLNGMLNLRIVIAHKNSGGCIELNREIVL